MKTRRIFPRRTDAELRARLLEKIDIDTETGCWNLAGGTLGSKSNEDGIGYAAFWDGSKQTLAHRTAYQVFVGPIPDGLLVMHRCDNRRCVNPSHLRPGTHQENMDDMVAKGRGARGDRSYMHRHPECAIRRFGVANPAAKLTAEEVEEIRLSIGSQESVGKMFGISQSQVSRIKLGQRRAQG